MEIPLIKLYKTLRVEQIQIVDLYIENEWIKVNLGKWPIGKIERVPCQDYWRRSQPVLDPLPPSLWLQRDDQWTPYRKRLSTIERPNFNNSGIMTTLILNDDQVDLMKHVGAIVYFSAYVTKEKKERFGHLSRSRVHSMSLTAVFPDAGSRAIYVGSQAMV